MNLSVKSLPPESVNPKRVFLIDSINSRYPLAKASVVERAGEEALRVYDMGGTLREAIQAADDVVMASTK